MTRRRRTTPRRARVTPLGGMWGAIAALFGFLAITTEMLLYVILALIGLMAAVVACVNPEAGKVAQKAAVPPPRGSSRNRAKPGGKAKSGRPPAKPGTQAQKPSRCGARCRRSTRPRASCDCVCKGRSHGSEVGRTFEMSRAAIKSSAAKRAEKAHVKENEQWRKRG